MFEIIGKKQKLHLHLHPALALTGIVISSFGLGLITGKLLTGARPFDWTMTVMEMMFDVFFAVFCAVHILRSHKRQ